MHKIYFDYNIYMRAIENRKIREYLYNLDRNKIQVFYSPAHMEELFKGSKEGNELDKVDQKKYMDIIEKITDGNIFRPSDTQVVEIKENPRDVYMRVKDRDTREIVKRDSQEKYEAAKGFYHNIEMNDKSIVEIKKETDESIWENKYVDKCINQINKNINTLISKYNSSIQLQNVQMNQNRKWLGRDFIFEKDSYKNRLDENFTELEYTIETLFNILNGCGYGREKNLHKTISGTHDITHAIYATKAEYLLTTDINFQMKCSAVYKYINCKTQCILLHVTDIMNELISILDIIDE